MSCKACETEVHANELGYGFRWKNANIRLHGCRQHIGEVIQALRDSLEAGPPEGATVPAPVPFLVNGFVASTTLEPAVDLAYGKIHMQCSAEKARELALMILECSESAMSDAFLVKFLVDKTGAPVDSSLGVIMQEFRTFRDEQRRKEKEQ